MSVLPLDAAGRRPAFFEQDGIDQMLSMIMEVSAGLWIVRERLFIVEAVLARHGVVAGEAVEAYKPSEAEQATLNALRAEMTTQIFRTLGRDHRPARG